MTITTKPDVTVANHGSINLVTPHTDEARTWIDHNVPEGQWFGRHLVVEPRYLENLWDGMERDGLVVA